MEESKKFEIGDLFTIDWDGKSKVIITDKDNENLTINRVDKKIIRYLVRKINILSYGDFSNMIISYVK